MASQGLIDVNNGERDENNGRQNNLRGPFGGSAAVDGGAGAAIKNGIEGDR